MIKVFLAGGISNCPNWQAEFTQMCKKRNLRVICESPRRIDWDESKRELLLYEQILWEHNHLIEADVIVFWFPKESLCPITLFELGKYGKGSKIIVGCHPEYKRKQDVILQLSLMNPSVRVVDSLEEVCNQLSLRSKL